MNQGSDQPGKYARGNKVRPNTNDWFALRAIGFILMVVPLATWILRAAEREPSPEWLTYLFLIGGLFDVVFKYKNGRRIFFFYNPKK